MNHDQLRAFCQLAQDRNYRIASEHLCITQSALTKKIQRLEEYLGAELFERGRQGAKLTPIGKVLLPEAQQLLQSMVNFEGLSRLVIEGTRGYLKIGFGVSTYHQAPKYIAEFKQHYPQVNITLNDIPSEKQRESLLNGDLQLSFNRLPVEPPLKSITLSCDHLVVAIHKDEKINQKKLWETLSSYPYLQLNPLKGPGLHQQIKAFLFTQRCNLKVEQEADDILTLLTLVSSRLGYTIVPASTQAISQPNIRFIPLDGQHSSWEVGVIWNELKPNPFVSKFIEIIEKN
ncbi:LysR family transcriptional regulator [Photobacterium sanctipauli]|uniref:LysR family transcriptional regulator n=1 Tax=Photobacterium sanctipauli TaxID=1342794 RepID=A0A2T3NNF1_9GAMM|nr:LysR family transcriptional regulator [Photobacterium sanctipauli]PSW17191.1 LysR family transcriptional regulator [Photobacterium sanctipauli]